MSESEEDASRHGSLQSPESTYRQSVFHVVYLMLKLLWLPPVPPFHPSVEKVFAVPEAEERSADVAG